MADRACERIRERLTLGPARASELDRHLADCEACRTEATGFRKVLSKLAEAPEVEVSPALDRAVRQRLLQPASISIRPFSRPALAACLAVGGLIAWTSALAGVLAQTGAAEQGAYVALLVALGYTTVSAAVTLPLLLMRGTHWLVRAREV